MRTIGAVAASFLFLTSVALGPSVADESITLDDELASSSRDPVFDSCYESAGCTSAPCPIWSAGFDFVFARPQFEGNVAFTTMESDGVNFENFTDTEFGYDFDLSPRVWLSYEDASGLGLRARYWQFDQASSTEVGTPPANGFGRTSHPTFGGVDISTTIPGATFTANSGLDAHTFDLEATKPGHFCDWDLLASLGLRYATVHQGYHAQLRTAANVLQGEIDFSHRNYGFGPTVALETHVPVRSRLTLFGALRGSVLFGDADSTLAAAEDLDLVTPFRTNRRTSRHDVLPIGELQIGCGWFAPESSLGQFYLHGAFEGQLWSGVGNATSEDGNLGFLGCTFGVGLTR